MLNRAVMDLKRHNKEIDYEEWLSECQLLLRVDVIPFNRLSERLSNIGNQSKNVEDNELDDVEVRTDVALIVADSIVPEE